MSRASTVPTRFRRPSKGYIHDSRSGSNNVVTNNGVYEDDGDLIQGHHAPGVGRVQGGSSRDAMVVAVLDPVGNAPLSRTPALAGLGMGLGGFNLGLSSPGLAGMPNGLNMAQPTQLNGMNGMNPFNMNMNMLDLATMGVSPEAQLLTAHIAAAGIWSAWAWRR
ncbi:hypothetical protein EDB86DRAFT_3078385 [Lactarius hatsudake]|nr:hypothetical protein EDB86DRAFT_3078385 [Lactarius hatsudake]